MRVILAAVAFCALSFLTGLAGDLANAPAATPTRAPSVRVALPPPLAAPLAFIRTSAATAETPAKTLEPIAQAASVRVEKARPIKAAPSKQMTAKAAYKRAVARAFQQGAKTRG